ncbi:MAG: general secretion pathway protein GspK [Betaproteobacteria bacterium]|nr:general secretion pathway protein GspK [Betaproteobacteria bacterium]
MRYGINMPLNSASRGRAVSIQGGAALIMALLVVALATVLATDQIWRQSLWINQLESQRDLAQTRLIAQAGIEWSRSVLAHDARTSNVDHTGEPWALKVPASRIEGAEIGGSMGDEQGKWNLNNLLASNGAIVIRELVIFTRLLAQLQLPPLLAATLGDWLDADSNISPDGAEDAYYLGLPVPYRSANRALSDLDGLLKVRGFDAAIVERLRPYVTVLPGYHRVNVNTADAILIALMIPELSVTEASALIAQRDRIPFRDVADFRARLPRQGINVNPDQLDTRSSYFSVRVHARYGRARVATEALLERGGVQWPIIVWQKFQ